MIVVLLHSARRADEVIFGDEIRALAKRHDRFMLHEQLTADEGRIAPKDLDRLCEDWREREAFVSGPGDMLDALAEHWEQEGDADRLHFERFQPRLGLGDGTEGEGGTITFLKSDAERGVRRQDADPRLRRGGRARPAVRLSRGDLPHMRR